VTSLDTWLSVGGFLFAIAVLAWARWRILSTKLDVDLDDLHRATIEDRGYPCNHPAHKDNTRGLCLACWPHEDDTCTHRGGAA
jgi:ABC-type nickel/cobalt efflux system permease component RcnA